MTRVYYREAVGALLVFDVTRASTFDAVLKWKDDLDSKVRLVSSQELETQTGPSFSSVPVRSLGQFNQNRDKSKGKLILNYWTNVGDISQ